LRRQKQKLSEGLAIPDKLLAIANEVIDPTVCCGMASAPPPDLYNFLI
jgi:hypothetical protein